MHLSDVLSWHGHELNADPEITGLKHDIHSFSQEVNVTVTHLQDICDATEKYNTFWDLIQLVLVGWPE